MNILKLINEGTAKLKARGIKSPQLDAEIFLSKILKKERVELLTNFNLSIKKDKILKFHNLIERRALKEPSAYILREKEFWGKTFEVNQNTLIPRPETELMVEKLAQIYRRKDIFVLDIGTGSGCILISLLHELRNSKGVGIDISNQALNIAKKNAKNQNLSSRIKFFSKPISNLFHEKFDLIVSNPPYIERRLIKFLQEDIRKYEPKIAIDGGNDGLDVIKKVIYKAREILKFNGLLALEIGNGQFVKVANILKKNNFRIKEIIKDYRNNIRCIIAINN